MSSDETIDVLAQKVEAVAKVNAGILRDVEAKYQANAAVVSGFQHEVKVSFSKEDTGGDDGPAGEADSRGNAPTLSFESIPVESFVRPLIEAWTAENVEALVEPKDFFNDKIDYSLKNYADVKRLQEQVPAVAEKWTFARDTPASRAQVRIFLSNLEKLQVALGQLQQLSLDENDPLSGTEGGDEVKRGLELVAQGWGLVEKHMKSASLEGRAAGGAGAGLSKGFGIDLVGKNIQVDGRILLKKGNCTGDGQECVTLRPVLTSGKHVLQVKIMELSGDGWIGIGVFSDDGAQDLMTRNYSANVVGDFFFGRSSNGYSWPGSTSNGLAWTKDETIEVSADCEARVLVVKCRAGSTTIPNIPVPCVFALRLANDGNQVEIL